MSTRVVRQQTSIDADTVEQSALCRAVSSFLRPLDANLGCSTDSRPR